MESVTMPGVVPKLNIPDSAEPPLFLSPLTFNELKELDLVVVKVKKKYLSSSGTLKQKSIGKLAFDPHKRILAVAFGSKADRLRPVAINTTSLAKVLGVAADETFRLDDVALQQALRDTLEFKRQGWVGVVKSWKKVDSAPGHALTPHFLEDVPYASGQLERAILVLVRETPTGGTEIGDVSVGLQALTGPLDVPLKMVETAAVNGELETLILRSQLTPKEHLDTVVRSCSSELSPRDGKEIVLAVDSLTDEGNYFGATLSNSPGKKSGGKIHSYSSGLSQLDSPQHDFEVVSHSDGSIEHIYVHLRDKATVGEGAFGRVSKTLVTTPRGSRVLAQKLPKTPTNDSKVRNELNSSAKQEAKIGKQLRGVPYVLQIFSYSNTDAGDISIVSELCEGGSWTEHSQGSDPIHVNPALTSLDVAEQWSFFAKALRGLAGIHAQGFGHRDLKGPNIYLKKNKDKVFEPRIGDFGTACRLGEKSRVYGTACFLPPETYCMHTATVTTAWDAFSMGVLALEAVVGKPPPWFANSAAYKQAMIKINLKPDPSWWLGPHLEDIPLPAPIKEALHGLLHGDSAQRMTIEDAIVLIEKGVDDLKQSE